MDKLIELRWIAVPGFPKTLEYRQRRTIFNVPFQEMVVGKEWTDWEEVPNE